MSERPHDDPRNGGHVYDWRQGGWRSVVAIESAGVLLDHRAHEEIWKSGSSAERCAMFGSSRSEPRHGAAKE